MKNLLNTIVLTLTMFAVFSTAAAEEITILHMSDTHSNMTPAAPRDENLKGTVGGAARAATYVGMTKMQDPNTIMLHGGDIFIGNLFFNKYFGVPELSLLKQLGCDAMTLGNHEFDLTPDVLYLSAATAFAEGGFPLLSANFETFDNPELEPLKSFVSPYTIIEKYDTKVGVFGLTTPEANFLSNPAPVFIDTLIVERAAMTVAAMKEQCDVIIFLSHLGRKYDEAIAYYVGGIDLIIGAHDHKPVSDVNYMYSLEGDQVPYVQSGPFYSNIGKTVLNVTNGEVTSVNYQLVELDENIPEEPTVKEGLDMVIEKIEETYGPLFSQQIGVATKEFTEECRPQYYPGEILDTEVGNLICDAFRDWGQTDIAIQPGGNTAQTLKQGAIVPEDVYRMMGYGFNTVNGLGYRMAKFRISGQALLIGLEFGLSEIEYHDDYLIQVSGMEYTCDLTRDPWNRLLSVTIGGVPIDPEKEYTVTADEFVPMFLDYMELPYSDLQIEESLTEFEVVVAYISQVQVLDPTSGRITPVEEEFTPVQYDSGCMVFPNPCQESVNISFNIEHEGYYQISVYNLMGEKIVTTNEKYYSNSNYTELLPTQNLNSGTYYFTINGVEVITGSFVVE